MSTAGPNASPLFTAAAPAFLLFAGQFVVAKHGVSQGLDPYEIAALRFGVAGLVAVPFLVRWGLADLAGVGWARGLLLAALAGAPGYLLMVGGLAFAPAAQIVVLNPGMTLIGGTLLAALWLGDPIPPVRAIAAGFGLLGLVLIGAQAFADPTDRTWIGTLMFAASGLVWALYMTLLHRWSVAPLRAAMLVAFVSLLYLPAFALFAADPFTGVPWPAIVLQAGYQGVVHGFIAMALFAYAVRALGAGHVAVLTPIVPVAGLLLSVLWLGERLGPMQWAGAAIVCGAMVLAAASSRRVAAR